MNILRLQALSFLLALLGATILYGQSNLAGISGAVLDSSGAVIPGATLTLTSVGTGVARSVESGVDGSYSFPNLQAGDYRLTVSAEGFRTLEQTGISLRPNQMARLDPALEVGAVSETVSVTAVLNPINFDNASQETGVGPDTLTQLPLLVSRGVRNIANFAVLVPGANFGGTGGDLPAARVNGGMGGGDQAVLDGATTSGMGNNQGFINFSDFKLSPDMIGEFRLITSNYEPHYGASTSSQLIAKTRSGANEYHGGLFHYHRNTALNARPWGQPSRPVDIENEFGGFLGGKIPGLNRGKIKTFGYVLLEGFRIRGAVNVPTLSIPSMKQRVGDFTDWTDGSGKLIPVYDPASTRTDANGNVVRDQFACGGAPNVICPSRISNSLANEWLQHLPTPTNNNPLNNYIPPNPRPFGVSDNNYAMYKVDFHPGDSDHISGMYWDNNMPANTVTNLPQILANEQFSRQLKDMFRLNWDHTFTPTLLNTFNYGWTQFRGISPGANSEFADVLPQVSGVGQAGYNPPVIQFSDGFENFGNPEGPDANGGGRNFIANNLTTWVKGKHTFKFGGEYWLIQYFPTIQRNLSGTFGFARATTGLLTENSGSPIASFLLERVNTASSLFRTVDESISSQDAYIGHFGDTWRVTNKLTLNMGVRWDMFRPARENDDAMSFFDPNRANPGAGGRLGALAFAGSDKGEASFGSRYPEHLFKKGFAPRIGMAFAVDNKTALRMGYGIFYSQVMYPGWNRGISQDGFNSDVSFSSTAGGLEPAMILSQGFPQNFTSPPFIDPSFRNGQSIFYRDFDGNKLPYSQQWNLTIEREVLRGASLSVGYVGNKGNRLPSGINPVNVLDPALLSMGPKLRDQFRPGQQSLHGVPLPYDGWVEQLGCAPSVAQALLPYPQYCDRLRATNENAGQSTYHSFQTKFQKELTAGTFVLASYTVSKMLTNNGNAQINAAVAEVYSPYERHRNKSLAPDDIPQNLTLSYVYELPFARGSKARGSFLKVLAGGWSTSGIFRATSGLPFWARSAQCNVPGEFRAQCVPAILEGANPYAQDVNDFDPGRGPLFDSAAFEPISSFQQFGYYGAGPRLYPNVRLPGLRNFDMSVYKNTYLTESMKLQLRFEFFNIFNLHNFVGSGRFGSGAFNRNLGTPNFGRWSGAVSDPRNVQLGARLEF